MEMKAVLHLMGGELSLPLSTPSQALPLAGQQTPHVYSEPQGQPVQKEGALPGPLQKEAMMARMHTMLR